jgi:hypothetical protein
MDVFSQSLSRGLCDVVGRVAGYGEAGTTGRDGDDGAGGFFGVWLDADEMVDHDVEGLDIYFLLSFSFSPHRSSMSSKCRRVV